MEDSTTAVKLLCVHLFLTGCMLPLPAVYGGKFPISASWFKPRFSKEEWDSVLLKFRQVGGDTILTRGAQFTSRTKSDIIADPDFKWCKSGLSSDHCVTETEKELTRLGLNIEIWATYKNGENYGKDIIACPKYEKIISTTKVYHRLVFQAKRTLVNGVCNFTLSKDAAVVFTVFSGVDSNEILINSASAANMSVYLGIPRFPNLGTTNPVGSDLLYVYFGMVNRTFAYYNSTYKPEPSSGKQISNRNGKSLVGYYSSNATDLASFTKGHGNLPAGFYMWVYGQLKDRLSNYRNKTLAVSLVVNLNRFNGHHNISEQLQNFEILFYMLMGCTFIIHEGRGMGNMAYYWKNQNETAIRSVDNRLFEILKSRYNSIPDNATFGDVFSGSVQELYEGFFKKKVGPYSGIWLNIEAFENLRDSPCLPLDDTGSGMDQLLDRTTKWRLDWAISAAGAYVQKVSAFAWDPDFECVNGGYQQSLVDAVISDDLRPIVSNCSFHSPYNQSVVVLGFNLDALTQAYEVTWIDRDNKTQVNSVHGFYFEMDYGIRHGLMPSLQYVMLFDIPGMQNIQPKGFITVQAGGAYHECTFPYVYRYKTPSGN